MKNYAKYFIVALVLVLHGASCDLFSNDKNLISVTPVDKSSRPGRVFLYIDGNSQSRKVSAYAMVPKRFRQAVVILDGQEEGIQTKARVRNKSRGCRIRALEDLILDVVAVDRRGRKNKMLRKLIRMDVLQHLLMQLTIPTSPS